MAADRFDSLARSFTRAGSRRRALTTIVGGALASIGMPSLAAATAKPQAERSKAKKKPCRVPPKIRYRHPKKGSRQEQSGCNKCCGGSFVQLSVSKGRCCSHNG